MALIYSAELHPGKTELLRDWVPGTSWGRGINGAQLEPVASYRFDDPDGLVGIETHLVADGSGAVLQVPLTYRPEPLADADGLIATMHHSELGQRWVYDGCHDPVYLAELVRTVLTGGSEVEQHRPDGTTLEPSARVQGSGTSRGDVGVLGPTTTAEAATSTDIHAGDFNIMVLRIIDAGASLPGAQLLTGTWPGRSEPATLALVARH